MVKLPTKRTREFLQSAVFYPASGLDPRPVVHLADRFQNFIYVDYNLGSSKVAAGFLKTRFPGYGCGEVEDLDPESFIGVPWMKLPAPHKKIPRLLEKQPFIRLVRLKKHGNRQPSTGAEEIHILFIRGEALVVYEALYARRKIVPACIAYLDHGIHEGRDFGDFPPLLAWKFLEKPNQFPRFLFHDYGGMDEKAADFLPLHPLYVPESDVEPDEETAPLSVALHKLMEPLDETEVKIAQVSAMSIIQMRRFFHRVEKRRRNTLPKQEFVNNES